MATMLQDNQFTYEKVEIGGRAFNIDSTSQIDIQEEMPTNFPVPERIVVRELDLSSGANGPIAWREPDLAHPCDDLTDVERMVAALLLPDGQPGSFDPMPAAMPYYRPLDLNLSIPTCFIIRLNPAWPWRFSHKAKGATLGPDVSTDPDNYCHFRHVRGDGTEQWRQFDHPDECRMVYFFARPPAGNPTPPFRNAFNLNVELLYPGGPAAEINSIPIVIDPDIRFPGGTP